MSTGLPRLLPIAENDMCAGPRCGPIGRSGAEDSGASVLKAKLTIVRRGHRALNGPGTWLYINQPWKSSIDVDESPPPVLSPQTRQLLGAPDINRVWMGWSPSAYANLQNPASPLASRIVDHPWPAHSRHDLPFVV